MFEIIGKWNESTRTWDIVYRINGGPVNTFTVEDVNATRRIEQIMECTD